MSFSGLLRAALSAVCCVFAAVPAAGQGVVLPAGEVRAVMDARVKAAVEDGVPLAVAGVVSGAKAVYLGAAGPAAGGDVGAVSFPLDRLSTLMTTLTALRLIETGRLLLDGEVGDYLADVDLSGPFDAPVTVRHLMTHSGGFAAPYSAFYDAPDGDVPAPGRLIHRVRSPGRVTSFDPVGIGLLALVIEAAVGQPFEQVLQRELLDPLALAGVTIGPPTLISGGLADGLAPCQVAAGVCDPVRTHPLVAPALGLWATPVDLSRLLQALAGGRDRTGTTFLKPATRVLLLGEQAMSLHPLVPGVTIGGFEHDALGRRAVGIDSRWRAGSARALWLMPDSDVGLFILAEASPAIAPGEVAGEAARRVRAADLLVADLTLRLALRFLPPTPRGLHPRLAELTQPTPPTGRYVEAWRPSPWLGYRLLQTPLSAVTVSDLGEAGLAVNGPGHHSVYRRQAPYLYVNEADHQLAFSVDDAGAFLSLPPLGRLYRKADLRGDPALMLYPAPIALAVLLTAAIYLRRGVNPLWRRMALFAVGGAGLLLVGLASELAYYQSVWLERGLGWPVVAWRAALNVGLAALLTLPLFAIQFSRRDIMPSGAGLLAGSLHLTALTAAALTLFALAIAWGVAGELLPP